MFEPKTVILAVVLSTPFGLAIHDEITREKPDLDSLSLSASLYGSLDTDFDMSAEGAEDAEIEAMLARLELEAEREAAALADEIPEPPPPPAALGAGTLSQLFASEPATPGQALAGVRFGMTRTEIQKDAPDLSAWELRSDELGRVLAYPEFMVHNNQGLSDVVLEIPDPDLQVETYLRERWGAPQIEADDELPAIWISPDGHTRAAMSAPDEHVSVVFSQVQSLAELLKPPAGSAGLFAFETGPALVGSDLDQITASYPNMVVDQYYQDYATLDVAGIASDPGGTPFTRVTMGVKSGQVVSLSMKIGCGSQCADVIKAFEARHGKSQSKRADRDSDRVYRFKTTPSLTLTIYAHEDRMVAVEVSR